MKKYKYLRLFEECLKLFDVVQTICGRHENMKSLWKWYNMHAYQVSSPCVSLRSEEVIYKKIARGYLMFKQSGCHGNDVTHMCTKFHLHACYSYQVWGVKKKVPEALCCCDFHARKRCIMHVYQVSPPCYSQQVWGVKLKKITWGFSNNMRSSWKHVLLYSSWKWYNRHTYQVSSLPLEILRSEEKYIYLKKSTRGYFLL